MALPQNRCADSSFLMSMRFICFLKELRLWEMRKVEGWTNTILFEMPEKDLCTSMSTPEVYGGFPIVRSNFMCHDKEVARENCGLGNYIDLTDQK